MTVCRECDGVGEIMCDECGGSGLGDSDKGTCEVCDGNGVLMCQDCGGMGELEDED